MLKLSHPNISDSAIDAVIDVLRSGNLVHGAENEEFERELAAYLGCAEVVLVSSGTAALHLAMMALGLGPGDAVVIPDFTFPATANVIALVGARPVLVDVEPDTYNLSIPCLLSVIENWTGPERLRAVMPVHEFGCPARIAEIQSIADQHSLVIVEDAACALGAEAEGGKKVGTFGRLGCFSFHPRKTLTTGEGGALATDDIALAQRLRRMRSHGMERSGGSVTFTEVALNYRLTQFQAALGRYQLPRLDEWIDRRSELASHYLQILSSAPGGNRFALPAANSGHSWQTFMITLPEGVSRATVVAALRKDGIESGAGAQCLSSIGLYGKPPAPTPISARLATHGLALPLFEQMTKCDVEEVCAALFKATS